MDTSIENIIAGNRRRSKLGKNVKWKSSINAIATIPLSKKRRPATAGAYGRRRRPSHRKRRPQTASINRRRHSSEHLIHSPRLPMNKRPNNRNKRRPSTANAINLRARRVYVKVDKRMHASQHTLHSSTAAQFSPRRPHTSNCTRRRRKSRSGKFRKFSYSPSSAKKYLMKSQPGPEVADTFHTPYK